MADPAPNTRRHFLVEIWNENREVFKVLIADIVFFLTILFALFVVFLAFRGMEKAGYPPNRLATFETLHYWAYHVVLVIFLLDMIMKLFLFLVLRRKP